MGGGVGCSVHYGEAGCGESLKAFVFIYSRRTGWKALVCILGEYRVRGGGF